jgi:hypothetical protein
MLNRYLSGSLHVQQTAVESRFVSVAQQLVDVTVNED